MIKSVRLFRTKTFLLALMVFGFIANVNGQDKKIRINGFGDMTYGRVFGSAASSTADSLFTNFGESEHPFNENSGFGLVGTDFVVTAQITENLTYQGEVNLQVERGASDEIGLDFERCYIDYKISDKLGIQAGLYFTPIGFSNRNLYARAWLMNSVQVRDVVEESTGLVPTHSTGVNMYGGFDMGKGNNLNYIISVSNGRGADPVTGSYARDAQGMEYTGLLEWVIPKWDDIRIGVSAVYNEGIETFKVDSLGSAVDMTIVDNNTALSLTEFGINPYIRIQSQKVSFFTELHLFNVTDNGGSLTEDMMAITAELAFHTKFKGKKLTPYVRYDRTSLSNNGPSYYGLRADGDMMGRVYVPEFNAGMIGLAYDINAFNRIKIEYISHFDGPRLQHGLVFQTAFGF